MKLENKQVAVVGGGPGGLMLARLLQLQGVKVKVYERDTDKNARLIGSPLDMHADSGLLAIENAGLLEEFKRNFRPRADRKIITNDQAQVFFSDHDTKAEENFGDPHFRPEIDRYPLREMLLNSLQPATVTWDAQFVSMNQVHTGWQLVFKNGVAEYADLVIAADGVNSKIRPYITDIKAQYSGFIMLEGNIRNARHNAHRISSQLRDGKLMAFGKSKNLLMGMKGDGELNFYASFRAAENWPESSGLNFSDKASILNWFREYYEEWSEVWYELFEAASVPFIPRRIYNMPTDQQWSPLANLTMIGDAAHVMPPFAGEGANMALQDALELSEVLVSEDFSNLQEAIGFYETTMRNRAAIATKESINNGNLMHSEEALERVLRFFNQH